MRNGTTIKGGTKRKEKTEMRRIYPRRSNIPKVVAKDNTKVAVETSFTLYQMHDASENTQDVVGLSKLKISFYVENNECLPYTDFL